jgi:hypothetical protein
MQDRYVGDAGDYAKYALLNALAGDERAPLHLGVLWYLFPDEGHNGDGRHIAYLQQPIMAQRDPETHARLKNLVTSGQRSVDAVQRAGLLPPGTAYHSALAATAGTPVERATYRAGWFRDGLAALKAADLLFFDPDNGIETPSLKKSDYRAGKYVFWEEIEAAWATGASIIVYNHLTRTAPATVQTAKLQAALVDRLPGIGLSAPLLFRRGSCRHLWVVAQTRHAHILKERIFRFLAKGWDLDTDCDLTRSA